MKRGEEEEEEEDNSPKEHESASVQDAFIITALYFFCIRSNYLEWGVGNVHLPSSQEKKIVLKNRRRENKQEKKK